MTKRTPFSSYLGYIAARQTGAPYPPGDGQGGRGWVVAYHAEPQGIDPADGGKYAVVCETHATLLQVESKAAALATLRAGSTEFCDCCRDTCGHGPLFVCPSCGRGGDTASLEGAA